MNITHAIGKVDQLEAYRRLGLAILEQAVFDIKMCKRARVIKDGKPIKGWPQKTGTNRKRVCNHFDSMSKVQEIVEWVHSKDCAIFIDLVDAPIEQCHLIELLERQQEEYRSPSIQRIV